MTDAAMLTIREAAKFLNISRSTLYRLVSENSIPAIKIGGQWRLSQKQINEWLKSESVEKQPSDEYKLTSRFTTRSKA